MRIGNSSNILLRDNSPLLFRACLCGKVGEGNAGRDAGAPSCWDRRAEGNGDFMQIMKYEV